MLETPEHVTLVEELATAGESRKWCAMTLIATF
jgi:hypothetical protein